jgi:dolichyl-phosphate beta-glucosyltransferase
MKSDSFVVMSLVIPAYNEAKRLPPYLTSVRSYLDATFPGLYEVIVVDDGSRDDLPSILEQARQSWPELSVLGHPTNRGKGAAVRKGMLAANGHWLLFADADGATPIEEERELRRALEQGADIAVGSRMRMRTGSPADRVWLRELCSRLFSRVVRGFLGLSVRDSQCGFKMFRQETGRQLFGPCCEAGYLFDLEILARARDLGYRIAEIPVRWIDVAGSKVRLVRDGWRMVLGLWRLRRRRRAEAARPAATLPAR